MKKEEKKKKKSKLRLKRISKPNEKLGVHSLNEVREVDSYTWVAKNITDEMGFPPCVKDTDDCLCCEGQLFVLRHGAEAPDQSTDSFGQVFTIINHESGSTSIFTRTLHPLQDNGEWTPWQMVATGDYELIAANNSINEILATLRQQLEDISKRVEAIETSLLASTTVRFHRIEENEATINAGEIDSTPAAIVYYKPANKFVAADSAGAYWDTWDGMETYMNGTTIRKDKVYLCGDYIYLLKETGLVSNEQENATGLGSISFANKGLKITDDTLLRNIKFNGQGQYLNATETVTMDLYIKVNGVETVFICGNADFATGVTFHDKQKRYISNKWYSSNNIIDIPAGAYYAVFGFRRSDQSDGITADEVIGYNVNIHSSGSDLIVMLKSLSYINTGEDNVVWPDGSSGKITGVYNDFVLAYESFEVSHTKSGLKVSQPTITYNDDFTIKNRPQLIVSKI